MLGFAVAGFPGGGGAVDANKWAIEHGGEYLNRANRLREVIDGLTPQEVLGFVLFTPQQRYETAVRDWYRWMRVPSKTVAIGNMWRTRQRYLDHMPSDTLLLRSYAMPWDLWVQYLVRTVKGLSWAKAPFFCSLMDPLSINVPVCLDVHMMRFLGFNEWDTKMAIESYSVYERAQARLQRKAKKAGLPSFVYQWAVWDYVRSGGEPVKETHIENDLDVYNSLRGREGRL